MNPSLKKYEAVATVVELRHLAADMKRLEQLNTNRLVVEHKQLGESVPAQLTDLDEKLAAYDEQMAAQKKAKQEAAAKAAAEGDSLVDDKPPAKPKAKKKTTAKKKAATKKS